MSFKLLVNNAIWSALAHLLGRGSLVVAAMLLSNKLLSGDFAAYSYFQLTVSMLATYSALGMGVTASRFFAEVGVVKSEYLQPLGALWLLSILIGLIICGLILLIPNEWISGGLNIPNWLLSLGVFVILLGIVPGGGILGLEQYKAVTFFSLVSAVILILGVVSLTEESTSYDAILFFILSMAVQSLGSSYIVFKRVGFEKLYNTRAINKKTIKVILNFAGPMFLASLMAASGSWLVGRIILSGDSGEYQFALYAIGLQWFSLTLFMPGMVSRVVLPRLIRAELSSGSDVKLTKQASLLTVGAAIFTVLVGALVSPFLLRFYGDEYNVSYFFLVIFMVSAVPASPANTLGNAIVSKNGQFQWLYLTTFWFVFLITISMFFVGFGAIAGAISYTISYTILAVLALIVAKRMRLV